MSAPIQWTERMRFRSGEDGLYRGLCPITGRHRVLEPGRGGSNGTTWLLDDLGRCRGDLEPCGEDVVGAA